MFLDLMRDKAKEMPTVPDPLAVESLRIWHCGYKSLSAIARFENVSSIAIATFPDPSLDALAGLKKLRHLSIVHLPNVSDLSPLSELTRLESLELATLPSWDASSKRTVVASLVPLTHLADLKHLTLLGVVSNERSLVVLERCPSLVSARFDGFPKKEVARFFAETNVENAHNPQMNAAEGGANAG